MVSFLDMRNIIQYSIPVVLAIFVLFVSMGVNISRMSCDNNRQVYLGYMVSNCQENEVRACCCIEINDICCCNTEKEICFDTFRESCTQESAMIQYDFETTVSYQKLIQVKSIILFNIRLNNIASYFLTRRRKINWHSVEKKQ